MMAYGIAKDTAHGVAWFRDASVWPGLGTVNVWTSNPAEAKDYGRAIDARFVLSESPDLRREGGKVRRIPAIRKDGA